MNYGNWAGVPSDPIRIQYLTIIYGNWAGASDRGAGVKSCTGHHGWSAPPEAYCVLDFFLGKALSSHRDLNSPKCPQISHAFHHITLQCLPSTVSTCLSRYGAGHHTALYHKHPDNSSIATGSTTDTGGPATGASTATARVPRATLAPAATPPQQQKCE